MLSRVAFIFDHTTRENMFFTILIISQVPNHKHPKFQQLELKEFKIEYTYITDIN